MRGGQSWSRRSRRKLRRQRRDCQPPSGYTPAAVTNRLAPFLLLALAACATDGPDTAPPPFVRGEQPAYTVQAPVLRRLTYSQYVHSIDDLFGPGLVLPEELEPDSRVSGLQAVGASVTSLSSLGVERYESAAYDIAEQVLADPARRAALVPCTPAGSVDEACAATVIEALGRRAWRRPLSEAERVVITGIVVTASTTLDDFDEGLAFGVAALLQSPHFLFRPEFGVADPDSGIRLYTSLEMASRLSFFLWDGPPDEALLVAAEAGDLATDAGVQAQVERMLEDAKARRGMRAFFTDMLALDELDSLTKDPTVYVYMSAGLGESAREQTLADAERLVFTEDVDFRRFLTSTETHLDRTLAALYDVPAPERDAFGPVTLPDSGGRRGFLGQASFLALQSHATSTSVTRRGQFIREVLLCQTLPTPPAGLNTSIPAASEDVPTMRDRVAQHLEDPSCAGCHAMMDPIGLGLENFDGVGRWRKEENGETIDPSGALDGASFSDAWELGAAVAEHAAFAPCVNDTIYRFATGHEVADAEEDLVNWHADGFHEAGYRVRALLADIAMGPGFRTVGGVE